MTRVLITDGNQRSALAAVRSLGRAGFEVYAADVSEINLASRSRYCHSGVRVPSPYGDEQGFVEALGTLVGRLGVDLVLPMSDISCAVLAEHEGELPASTQVGVADREKFWRASDKNTLHTMAQGIGVPTPAIRYLDGTVEPASLEDVPVPCVIKPARSLVRTPTGWERTAVLRAGSLDELKRSYRDISWLRHPSTVQHLVEGEGLGLFALYERGRPRIMFQHRRLREKPPWGGVSVLREAVPVDSDVATYATRLLSALEWHGVAMVEFKRDRATGTAYLMEVNPRFWGSLQLAIDAGIDFPVEAVRLWTGQAISAQSAYRTGVRSRWLLGDLDHLLIRLSGKEPIPRDAPHLWELALDFLNVFRRDTQCEVESWRDPGPSVFELRSYLLELFGSHVRS